ISRWDGFWPIKFSRDPICANLPNVITGYINAIKSGRRLILSLFFITGLSKWVPKVDAKWPPAEKPITPTLAGFMFHWLAFLRIINNADCASCNGPMVLLTIVLSLGKRYFNTTAFTPILLKARAI